MMLVSLLLALGWFPKVGMLRQAYHRVASGGAAFEPGEKDEKLVDIDEVDEHNVSSAWNAIIPLAALVGGTVLLKFCAVRLAALSQSPSAKALRISGRRCADSLLAFQ